MVTGVMVEQLTATSVRVSWDEIPVDGITYRVYYSQTGNRKRQSTEVSMDSTTNSVDIDGLDSNVEYQFQVVATAIVNGETIEGERSEVNNDSLHVLTSPSATIPAGNNFYFSCMQVLPLLLLYRLQPGYNHCCVGDLFPDPLVVHHCLAFGVWHLSLLQEKHSQQIVHK